MDLPNYIAKLEAIQQDLEISVERNNIIRNQTAGTCFQKSLEETMKEIAYVKARPVLECSPFDILPKEMWEEIFKYVTIKKDIVNICNASPQLSLIMEKSLQFRWNKAGLFLGQVLPHLVPYFQMTDIIPKCLKISEEWSQFITQNVHLFRNYNRVSHTSPDLWEYIPLPSQQQILSFMEDTSMILGNPELEGAQPWQYFSGKCFRFNCWSLETCDDFWQAASSFMTKYGKWIGRVDVQMCRQCYGFQWLAFMKDNGSKIGVLETFVNLGIVISTSSNDFAPGKFERLTKLVFQEFELGSLLYFKQKKLGIHFPNLAELSLMYDPNYGLEKYLELCSQIASLRQVTFNLKETTSNSIWDAHNWRKEHPQPDFSSSSYSNNGVEILKFETNTLYSIPLNFLLAFPSLKHLHLSTSLSRFWSTFQRCEKGTKIYLDENDTVKLCQFLETRRVDESGIWNQFPRLETVQFTTTENLFGDDMQREVNENYYCSLAHTALFQLLSE